MEVLLPDPLSFTVIVKLADAPLAIFPRLQLIVTVPTGEAEQGAPCSSSRQKSSWRVLDRW
jgi:hypothetical protein